MTRECECPDWWHDVDDPDDWECVPPPIPRPCCGRLDVDENEEIRTCRHGKCRAWWCLCGKFTGMSEGPVQCGCEYDVFDIPIEDYCDPEGVMG